ncbi:MAG: efflux RND transporter periplasmic adaptor subunit [Opitutae bacterium]|nr:efflux RND transporter periplasmic adaptor subunit [Opitutae bacterium]
MTTRLLPLLTAAGLLLAGCSRGPETAAAASPDLPGVKVRTGLARASTQPAAIEITGTVRPVNRAHIAAKLLGTVAEMPVALGQRVNAGDLLLRLDAAEISARLTQAQAQLNQAQRDLARESDLLPRHASTAEMVRSLEDRVTLTGAMVREAEVMLGYATLRAPFAGVVAQTMVRPGDLAAPGQPLLELEGAGDFQIEAGVPESLVAGLQLGSDLPVTLVARDIRFNGRLKELSSAADPQARTVLAKLTVPAGTAVRSGEFVRVQLPGAAATTILAPAAAVSHLGQMERVFAVEHGRVVLRLVKTGARVGDEIEILSGLAGGEPLILAAPAGLREGQPVEVLP